MKKLLPAYILSFVMAFMLYVYEPLTMYGTNVNDFWFDLYILLPQIIIAFLLLFFLLSGIFTLIYFANKKWSKKINFYNISIIFVFVLFICFYIQGNYLVSGLPPLDGTNIEWGSYKTQNLISIIMCSVVTLGVVLSCIKFKMENVINVSKYISLAVMVMLITSLVSTCLTYNLVNPKRGILPTMDNYNRVSTDTNFFIFLLDAVDSVDFDDVMSNDKDFKNTFQDFTYFKDTTSVYGYTRDSVPQVVSGKVNENKTSFATYSTEALDNSLLLNTLKEYGYEMNIYDDELIWNSDKISEIDNLVPANRNINTWEYIKNQSKYVLFKYLPFPLKKYSQIEHMYFNNSQIKSDNYYTWSNTFNNSHLKNDEIEFTDNKYFNFLHVEGAHVPFGQTKDLTSSTGAGYKDKIAASLTLINTYINRLKENGVYDNSVIIILSDHGYVKKNASIGRQNPILFIKGVNEHHDMIRSNIPVSYLDLDSAYMDLLDGKSSTELFSDIPLKRERRFLWYEYTKENHMVEYVQTGKAWDEKTLKKTGREFNR